MQRQQIAALLLVLRDVVYGWAKGFSLYTARPYVAYLQHGLGKAFLCHRCFLDHGYALPQPVSHDFLPKRISTFELIHTGDCPMCRGCCTVIGSLPRTLDPQLEQRVVSAALCLLDAGGLPATLRAVSRQARTTTPIIYERFTNRDKPLQSVRRKGALELVSAVRLVQSIISFVNGLVEFLNSAPPSCLNW